MSRTKRRASPTESGRSDSAFPAPASAARALLVTALVAAAIPAAYAQDASPPAAQSANPSSAAGDGKAGPQASTDADKSGKPPPVCFKLSGRCVEPKKTPASKGTGSPSKDGSSAQARPPAMNLTAPDVRTVVPAEELKEPLPSGEQITEAQEDQTVSIKGEGVPPDVPMGFGAIWWALNHPSQAWRVVAPYE